MGEMAAQLDLVQAQNKRTSHGISNIVVATGQQSDNVSFILDRQAQQAGETKEIKQELGQINQRLDGQGQSLEAILSVLRKLFDN